MPETSGTNNSLDFSEHLGVLRKHLIRIVLLILVSAIIAFLGKDFIFDNIIFGPQNSSFITNKLFCYFSELTSITALCINSEEFELINFHLAGQFRIHLSVSIVVGIIAAFPLILNEFWKFIKPALKKSEKKQMRGFVFYTTLLFTFGILFGYFLISPLTVNFLSTYEASAIITDRISIQSYISTINGVTLSTGIVFELPLIIYLLSKIGMVTPELLKRYRKHAIVIFFILSAIITPPDVISQFLVATHLFSFTKQVLKYPEELTK